ncbi:hypothetical protein [Sulfuracidifex tepidarius]|uniref:Rubrerythrin diiron-binding domain-containing protein n=1 Tax=Sulfuracidifex tepidarius TaxID=1294262 RepID=A0A510DRE2_9CREN|nr:hypothetical protein [Sulfuracidifex tepidarius]BBG22747.1 hypothetical protein IC006_0031 [Sulfuracidifex tepidarius]BBG25526.1 hypothetical protein IC007_0031 [Sulfuracidifex tepidarius]
MDKYFLALLGEAGATGLAKGFSFRYKVFLHAYEEEKSHWNYFKNFRRSVLESPVFYTFLIIGILSSILGQSAVKFINRKAEEGAIDFYKKNFESNSVEIMQILEQEFGHLSLSYGDLRDQ